MKLPTPRVLAAAALFLAAAAWASPARDQDSAAAGRAEGRAQAWTAGASSPESFERLVEGSRDHPGAVPDPAAAARLDAAFSARPALESSSPRPAARPEEPPVPLAFAAPAGVSPARRGYGRLALFSAGGLAGGLACSLLLFGAGSAPAAVESPPPLYARPVGAAPEAIPPSAPPPPRAWTPPAELEPPAAGAASDPYAGVSSWRAISWREQRLIDLWDGSREKSLGRASLDEWLDAHGPFEGVDLPLMKAKLFREA
ncbi:MAG TPA: hypothetical protein VH309_03575 [Elusimicrobiota bacterium]|nr:hypothetical protein [Elusimicrobiota bacterium]